MATIPPHRFLESGFDPEKLALFSNQDSLWYESPEEVEEKLRMSRLGRAALRKIWRVIDNETTDRQRVCLRLYYAEGKSLREIGEILGLHFSTVDQHIKYGLARVRRLVSGKSDPRFRLRPKDSEPDFAHENA